MKMPSFNDFVNVKNPAMAILYVTLLAVGGLYIDQKSTNNRIHKENKETIASQNQKINNLYGELGFLTDRVRRADSALADMTATLRVLKQVGTIK